MVRTDPITNSKIALTNIIKPKDSSLRQNSMWTRTLNAHAVLASRKSQSCCFCGGCRAIGWWLPEWLSCHTSSRPALSAT